MPPTRSSVARRVTVGHDDNHRNSLALGNKVIHDLRSAAEVAPGRLVATMAMQQVHHREALLAVVGCRQIDRHAALRPQRGTVVPAARKRAAGHVIHLIQVALVGLAFRHDEDIAH